MCVCVCVCVLLRGRVECKEEKTKKREEGWDLGLERGHEPTGSSVYVDAYLPLLLLVEPLQHAIHLPHRIVLPSIMVALKQRIVAFAIKN